MACRDLEEFDVDPLMAGPAKRAPNFAKIAHKMSNLPTLEKLLEEKDPNKLDDAGLEHAVTAARALLLVNPTCEADVTRFIKHHQKQTKRVISKSALLGGYHFVVNAGHPRNAFLEEFLVSKAPRSQSGVLVVTIFTSAFPEVNGVKQTFSCKWNCYYCPNEPGQPRSYLLNEPGVRRANRLDFDPVRQFSDRVGALVAIGHPADKVELLVLGGTWESYPDAYREQFIRDTFFAANTYFDPEPKRPRLDLLQEQLINENAKCKIIGVTLETRPDTINPDMIVRLRQFGCTRVQLGVQHTNDSILTAVNREATRADTVRAIRLLKDSCFKVDIHLMPDLPGSTPALDKAMFDDVLGSPDLQADQWKIYPCQTTPFTVIKRWYEEGKYASYGLESLIDVILYVKRKVHPWIRLNRVIRDIPVEYVLEGVEVANLRQLLQIKLERAGERCNCIRCREVKGDKEAAAKMRTAVLRRREYAASRGTEVFYSFETPCATTLFGFLRLRFPAPGAVTPFAELTGRCALIRELHVYGNLVAAQAQSAALATGPVGRTTADLVQHSGFGTRLLVAAENEAITRGMTSIAVISGIGVRNYYRKRGYDLVDAHRGGFLVKTLDKHFRDPLVARALKLHGCSAADGVPTRDQAYLLRALIVIGVVLMFVAAACGNLR